MATQVQTARGSATGTGVTVNWPGAPAEGNLLIAVVCIAGVADQDAGSIPDYTLVSQSTIGSAGLEHIQVFAKVAGDSESNPAYTHGSSSARPIHMHILELATVPSGTIRDNATDESVAIYNHDAEATLDNSAWDTGPLAGEGILIIAYSVNGTTNTSGWTVGSSFNLLAQPLSVSDASLVAWKQSSEEETVELAGGNGRSGLSALVNILLAPVGSSSGGKLGIDIGIQL